MEVHYLETDYLEIDYLILQPFFIFLLYLINTYLIYTFLFIHLISSFFCSVSRSFAIFSTFGILFLYILSTTFLVGCIALDFKRREEVRPAVSGVQCTRGVARARLSAPCVAKLVFLCIILRAMLDFF